MISSSQRVLLDNTQHSQKISLPSVGFFFTVDRVLLFLVHLKGTLHGSPLVNIIISDCLCHLYLCIYTVLFIIFLTPLPIHCFSHSVPVSTSSFSTPLIFRVTALCQVMNCYLDLLPLLSFITSVIPYSFLVEHDVRDLPAVYYVILEVTSFMKTEFMQLQKCGYMRWNHLYP